MFDTIIDTAGPGIDNSMSYHDNPFSTHYTVYFIHNAHVAAFRRGVNPKATRFLASIFFPSDGNY